MRRDETAEGRIERVLTNSDDRRDVDIHSLKAGDIVYGCIYKDDAEPDYHRVTRVNFLDDMSPQIEVRGPQPEAFYHHTKDRVMSADDVVEYIHRDDWADGNVYPIDDQEVQKA